MLKISLEDNISPTVKYWIAQNPKFLQSLAKSMGWFVRKRIKELINNDTLANRWEQRAPLKVRKMLSRRNKASKKWLGGMRNAIVYQYKGDNVSIVGWASSNAAAYGKDFEEGRIRGVTPAIRRYYAYKKIPLSKNKNAIILPKRPIYAPAMAIIDKELPEFVQGKVARYMAKGREGFSAPKRLYEVFK